MHPRRPLPTGHLAPRRGLPLAVLVLLLFAGSAPAPAWAGRADLEGAVVRWDAGLEAMGALVARRLPDVRREVEERFGWPVDGAPAEVVVVEGYDRMKE
ncbi:MAG: hypothetical protein ACYTG6_09740, partial [Planctomycetota bacterium]